MIAAKPDSAPRDEPFGRRVIGGQSVPKLRRPGHGPGGRCGGRMRILFVCSRNQWRSPTAEKIFRREVELQVRSAGTSPKARRTLTLSDLKWADLIVVMERKHKERIVARHGRSHFGAPIRVLNIPDEYRFMDPELQELLRQRVEPWLAGDVGGDGEKEQG